MDRAGVRYLGYMPGRQEFTLPERHLGLIPTAEGRPQNITTPGHASRSNCRSGRPTGCCGRRCGTRGTACTLFPVVPVTPKAAIAVAMDQAFNFYYPDSLDLLTAWGAELVPFRPLEDARAAQREWCLYWRRLSRDVRRVTCRQCRHARLDPCGSRARAANLRRVWGTDVSGSGHRGSGGALLRWRVSSPAGQ